MLRGRDEEPRSGNAGDDWQQGDDGGARHKGDQICRGNMSRMG
jgi:hypothetical protein